MPPIASGTLLEDNTLCSGWGIEDDRRPPTNITRFEDIQTRKKIEVGMVTGYLQHWTCAEAFREVYQNCEMESCGPSVFLRDFSPGCSERYRVILIEKRHSDTKKLLDYIRFTYKKDGCATTKADDDKQSGKHGEGFKVAALIFRRHPNKHTFRVKSSGVSCNIIFNPGRDLACTITQLSKAKFDVAKEHPGDDMVANPMKDVSIYIGEPCQSRNSKGDGTRTNRIHIGDYGQWLNVMLDINLPTARVQTRSGTLILDPAYKNKFDLQGLLLPSGSMSGKQHRYNYDFSIGSTTRDRDSLSRPGQEARQIGEIWSAAILDGAQRVLNFSVFALIYLPSP
ncbi:hypothetical protein K458DRAFT_427827 [Lentithecium fluviatile CBS 122367]|uniref:Uncharacterized protein n=1 Tax=Lentithecium fluviatile CBS 122367 TaxID=1168545 RepID=A0A6G1JGW8_9PLEO|nr:hypothetical protein K458DRAFT_427827 [Lentithecium fluviatile CBS 122367]